jgi:hypothetical protein
MKFEILTIKNKIKSFTLLTSSGPIRDGPDYWTRLSYTLQFDRIIVESCTSRQVSTQLPTASVCV